MIRDDTLVFDCLFGTCHDHVLGGCSAVVIRAGMAVRGDAFACRVVARGELIDDRSTRGERPHCWRGIEVFGRRLDGPLPGADRA